MLIRQIALTSETKKVSLSELSKVAAALQKQTTRDLVPIWEIKATVDAFAKLNEVPIGYWPIVVTEEDLGDAAGIHEDKDGQPFSLVKYGNGWSLTASHECLEMLVDPFGNRLVSGPSGMKGQGRVRFLVEICDPSEDTPYAYRSNGILVSDFYTPDYFDPVTSPNIRYSFSGAIKHPRQVLKGGYLSWHEPKSDHWFQETFFSGNKSRFRDLGKFTAQAGQNLRSLVYKRTPERLAVRQIKGKDLQLVKATLKANNEASENLASHLSERVREVITEAKK
ncbi:MAG: hypothetical protein E6J74_05750 [Deltaproteobacteria bacterium]|nr:MAG: hypothetical protein E6J74_05750 [Deltaproteobacteria bacterium]